MHNKSSIFAEKQEKERENQYLWQSCAIALAALVVSALLLLAGYLLLSPDARAYRSGDDSAATGPRVIGASDLIARIGIAKTGEDDGLALTQLAGDRAVLTRHLVMQAQDYDFLRYRITDRNPSETVYLIWRTAENPGQLFNLRLDWSGNMVSTVRLAGHPDWQGSITEIGLDIYGELRGQALGISDLTLLPGSAGALLSAIWSQWTAFTGWTQKSINYLGDPDSPLPTPVEAAAAWGGLAMALLLLAKAPHRGQPSLIVGLAVLVPWIALDLLWQRELNTQEIETQYLFSGKTMHERHLADEDSEFYSYAKRLKAEVLPAKPSRIFILHESLEHDYERLKTQFYLLPHNIYNYGRFPKKQAVTNGDYILVLGTIPGLKYNEATGKLLWNKGQNLDVRLLDRSERGLLFTIPGPGVHD